MPVATLPQSEELGSSGRGGRGAKQFPVELPAIFMAPYVSIGKTKGVNLKRGNKLVWLTISVLKLFEL